MAGNDVVVTTISNASSYEEIGEYWDSHSTADHWSEGRDVQIDVRMPRRQRIAIEAELYERLREAARRQGVGVETLVNVWLARELTELVSSSKGIPNVIAEESVPYGKSDSSESQLAGTKSRPLPHTPSHVKESSSTMPPVSSAQESSKSASADEHKRKVIELLKQHNPRLRSSDGRRWSLLHSPDKTLHVFVTFSKEDQLFYDVHPDDIAAWTGPGKSAFLILVAGSSGHAYVVPLERVSEGLKKHQRSFSPQGGYKLHLDVQRHIIKEVPDLPLKPFLNAYAQLNR